MIYNVTYNDRKKEVSSAINKLVGKPFGLIANLKKRGIGSQPYTVLDVNEQLREYTGPLTNLSKCNIELRPSGIIIYFSHRYTNFAWPIPYHHLTIYQNGEITTIFHHTDFIKFKPKIEGRGGQLFLKKVLHEKNQYLSGGQIPFG
ncbi:hypothetical protein GYB22_09600 [bacterium]|nr:hypothetical protein [bacterium]